MGREDRQEEGRRQSSARRRAETHVGGFDRTCVRLPEGFTSFQVKAEGVKRLEIAPYRVGKGNPYADEGTVHFERTYFNHRSVGPNEDPYVCLAKTCKLPCPICEVRAKLSRSNDKEDADAAKELMFKERQLWWVRDHAEFDKGWQLWDVSYHLFGKQLDARIKDSDPEDGYDLFYDRVQGSIIKVGFGEKSFGGNAFFEARSFDFKRREEPLPKSIFEELPCLDDLIIITPYDKLKKIFLQTAEGEEEADAPPPKKSKAPPPEDDDAPVKPKKPAKAPVTEEDEDDGNYLPPPKPKKAAPVEEEEAAPPPKKPKAAAPPPDDEDDWETPAPAKPKKALVKDEEDVEAPPPKPKKPRPAPTEDDDAETPPTKKPKAATPPADDDDWGEDWNTPAPAPKKARAIADDE